MTESVCEILPCMGHHNGGSVLHDIFGYSMVPKEMSVRDQLISMYGKHYLVNVIRVASENMFSGDIRQICYSLQVTGVVHLLITLQWRDNHG